MTLLENAEAELVHWRGVARVWLKDAGEAVGLDLMELERYLGSLLLLETAKARRDELLKLQAQRAELEREYYRRHQ